MGSGLHGSLRWQRRGAPAGSQVWLSSCCFFSLSLSYGLSLPPLSLLSISCCFGRRFTSVITVIISIVIILLLRLEIDIGRTPTHSFAEIMDFTRNDAGYYGYYRGWSYVFRFLRLLPIQHWQELTFALCDTMLDGRLGKRKKKGNRGHHCGATARRTDLSGIGNSDGGFEARPYGLVCAFLRFPFNMWLKYTCSQNLPSLLSLLTDRGFGPLCCRVVDVEQPTVSPRRGKIRAVQRPPTGRKRFGASGDHGEKPMSLRTSREPFLL